MRTHPYNLQPRLNHLSVPNWSLTSATFAVLNDLFLLEIILLNIKGRLKKNCCCGWSRDPTPQGEGYFLLRIPWYWKIIDQLQNNYLSKIIEFRPSICHTKSIGFFSPTYWIHWISGAMHQAFDLCQEKMSEVRAEYVRAEEVLRLSPTKTVTFIQGDLVRSFPV